MLPTEQGTWIGTDYGAFRVGKTPFSLTNKNGLLANAVRAFAKTFDSSLWIATAGGGVVVFDESQGKVLNRYGTPSWTTCLLPDAGGRMWIGTSNNGVAVFNPADSTWTQTTEKQGFPHQMCAP